MRAVRAGPRRRTEPGDRGKIPAGSGWPGAIIRAAPGPAQPCRPPDRRARLVAVAGPVQEMAQMGLHRRPLGGDDAIDTGVAQGAIAGELVAAQDAVELGPKSLDV